jgi:hypothetical protein
MKSIIPFLFLLFIANIAVSQDLTIGVVEFEEKNNIGIQNSGKIVAEWVVTEISALRKFRVSERLLLQKVLEEQKLMLSGLIDETQAIEIGKIYNVDAIITGSVMKVGTNISITGRIINVKNGEVLKTAKVTTDNINQVETEAQVLANNLCDISRTEFEVREDIKEKSITRVEIGGGFSFGHSSADSSGMGLSTLLRFNHLLFTLWIDGTPLGSLMNIEGGGIVNVTHFLGLGGGIGMSFDNMIDYVETTYVLFGGVFRPRINMEFGLFFGGTLSGTIWTESNNPIDGIEGYWGFPSNFKVWITYELNDQITLVIKYLGVSLGQIEDQIPGGYQYPDADYEYGGGNLSIYALYSFGI